MANQNAQPATPAPQPALKATDANAPAQNILEDVCEIESKEVQSTTMIERPPIGETREVSLEQGRNYIFGFDKSAADSFVVENGTLTITFDCGGKLVLNNYVAATSGDDAATFAFSDVVPQGELSALIKVVDTTTEQEDPENTAKNEKTARTEGEDVANIEPAAGDEDAAQALAQIEPAAGEAGGGAGGNSGYGFNTPYSSEAVGPLAAVGPLGATALNYGANFQEPNPLIGEEATPISISSADEFVDETNLGPIVETGKININYGEDGPGGIGPNGNFFVNGSQLNGNLTSGGDPVVISATPTGYVGIANGVTIFTLDIESPSGNYTFTLFGPLDHADPTDPNDVINITFGFTASDFDGDTLNTSITVGIADDVPTLESDGVKFINEDDIPGASVSGNLVEDFGSDGEGEILPNGNYNASGDFSTPNLQSNGHDVVVTQTANGYVGTANGVDVFNITINPTTGAYTFNLLQPLDHSVGGDTITLTFGAIITDYDGDSDPADIVIKIVDDVPEIKDDNPQIGNGLEVIDETNMNGGDITVNGNLPHDTGADTPATIAPNGNTQLGGSFVGPDLMSNGVPVVITQTANGYVGTANGQPVFTFTIQNNGNYSFTLHQQLDHADGTNANDVINLRFGVTITDNDGDTDSGFVNVNIVDDAPVLTGDGIKVVDEDDLSPASVSGNLVEDFGEDGQGDIHTTDDFAATGDVLGGTLTSNGNAVTVTSTPTGYVGTANGVEVFNLTINPVTGAYTFNLLQPLDHSAGGNNIILTFGAEIVDYDGDTDPADIVIKVKDDVPEIKDHNPQIGNGLEVVDETNLGPIVRDGVINFDFGGDGPGSFGPSGTYSSSIALTSVGEPVTITPSPTGYVGTANGNTIFTITINGDGTYQFTLLGVLDHPIDGPTPADHDDIITLNFGVRVSDADGDTDTGNIVVRVHDDGPEAHDDFQQYDEDTGVATGNVITGENGGPDAADDLSNDPYENGAQNHVTQISFGGNTVNVPEVGTVSIDGNFGTLTIASDGSYTYQSFANANGGGPKTFAGSPGVFPDMDESEPLDANEQQALGIADGDLDAGQGDVVGVSYVSEVAGYSNTLGGFTVAADGTLQAARIIIPNSDNATPGAGGSFIAGAGTNAIGFFAIANGFSTNGGYAGIDLNAGSLNFVFDYGLPTERPATIHDDGSHVSLVHTNGGVDTVLNGPIYFTTERGSPDNLNPDDTVRVVSDLANEGDNTVLRIGFEDLPALGDRDYNDLVFDVTIRTADCNCDCGTDEFTYTLTDGDGDTSTAVLALECLPDDKPIVVAPSKEVVDESFLGPIVETGTIQADYFGDGPGAITPNGTFTSTGSKLGGNLTSNGHEVTVTPTANGYVGTANGSNIFTLTINPTTGAYTFTLLGVLDHADGANANDIITLNFGVVATDSDGDTASTQITVDVRDDAPVAVNDGPFNSDGNVLTGNVLTNDDFNNDGPGAVIAISFNGSTTNIPAGGTVSINGTYGTLQISSNGNYTYTPNNNAEGTDQFRYTMDDYDNDTASATLTIAVDSDDCPILIKPAKEVVDETFLGPIVENGVVQGNFFGDGPGVFSMDGNFSSSGSKLGGNLTSLGHTVTVTNTATGYVGTANGAEVFTITINPDTGAYTFTLKGVLDHADGSNPNDVITLNFGVRGTDQDGDYDSTVIRVDVLDDAPIANDDHNTQNGIATGNVVTGLNGGPGAADDLSNDLNNSGSNTVTKISFGGTTVDVPAVGQATINGNYGVLKISADGSYTYTPNSGATGVGSTSETLVLADAASGVKVEVDAVQTATGVEFTIDLVNGIADLNGFYLDLHGNGGPIISLGGGNTMSGAHAGFDYAVVIGTVGGNDADTTHAVVTINGLTLGDLENAKIGIRATSVGDCREDSLKLVGDIKVDTSDCGCGEDQFVYTLRDRDGDTDTAKLTLECTPDTNVGIVVNNGADKICIKEDGQGTVPVVANYTGGDGDEVLSLKVEGIQPNWTVTAPGWTNQGGGVYTLTLPAGQHGYAGNFTFQPPANSDIDMKDLKFTATITDPDTGTSKTATDLFTVQVDAVVDTPTLTVPSTIATQNWYYKNQGYQMPLNISSKVTDTDGSEIVTKILIDLKQPLSNPVHPFYTLDDMGIGLNKGTEVSPGIWEITVNAADAATALNGLKLVVPNNMDYTKIHNSNIGGNESVNIVVKTFVKEKVAQGDGNGECDFSDNETCVIKSICLTFRITPLVLDLDGNGIDVVSAEAGIMFDMNNNGTLDKTSWVGAGDGFLAIDSNNDGTINNQAELFGNTTTVADGFANLAQYDSNGDGKIDASDDIFADLIVWKDANQDGVSQADEQFSLNDLGITSISLNATETGTEVEDAYISHESTYTTADGQEHVISDVWFNVIEGNNIDDGVTLDGTDGQDAIYGTANNDVLIGNAGNDVLFGGEGEDIFVFGSLDGSVDTIADFEIGDVLDVSGLVQGFDPVQDSINEFVFGTEVDGNTVISVDATGSGDAAHATVIAVIEGSTGLDLQQIIAANQSHV